MENQKKTVIITGGGQVLLDNGRPGAIGYGIACAFAKAGWNIVITGRNKQKLYDAKESLEKEYDASVLCVPADIEYGQDNEKVDQFKEIHGLVNCAQASASGVPFEQQTLEQFNLAIYSGLYATFFYMKAAYPYLKKTKGSIVNFGSGAALFG
ncbi:SDR family NAD(P)-dependent oxidoreductase, partial [Dubosiella newyorkensis]